MDQSAKPRDLCKIQGREPVRINAEDAAARGIEDGDLVGLYNDRGTIIAGAVVSGGIMPGVVSIREEGWPSLDGKGRCNSGLVNFLTSTRRASGLSQATTANTASCSMRKCEDPEGPNMAYEKPEIIEDYGIAEIDEDLLGLDRLSAITEFSVGRRDPVREDLLRALHRLPRPPRGRAFNAEPMEGHHALDVPPRRA